MCGIQREAPIRHVFHDVQVLRIFEPKFSEAFRNSYAELKFLTLVMLI